MEERTQWAGYIYNNKGFIYSKGEEISTIRNGFNTWKYVQSGKAKIGGIGMVQQKKCNYLQTQETWCSYPDPKTSIILIMLTKQAPTESFPEEN